MKSKDIEIELKRLSYSTGILACALVAIDSGIIYSSTSSSTEFQRIAESARDYWSLHHRNGAIYNVLGDLDNIKIRHKKGIICLQPCGENTLLVALTKFNKVDWNDWIKQTDILSDSLKHHFGLLAQ
ncbi:MAG: hypothetical protein K6L75_03400 [Cellvibrionaceae bacterium]